MSDVPTTTVPIQLPATVYRAPVSESLLQQMGGAINYLLDFAIPVGSVMHSMLTTAQFTSQVGVGDWLLADGSSCAGTRYASLTGATTVPDLRGIILRGKNNGRSTSSGNSDGDLSLGTYQADQLQDHFHSVKWAYNAGVDYGGDNNTGMDQNTTYNSGAANSANVGNETRPRSVTVNIFIRVN